jgi:hypothetical protein
MHNVLLVYKNMSPARDTSSHTGLGVTALNLSRILRRTGSAIEVRPVFDGYELRDKVLPGHPATHVVMFAPWVDTPFLQGLLRKYPQITFSVTCHSNVGFLQADNYAVKLMREAMNLELINHNFHLAANSERLANAVRNAFRASCTLLPNMYQLPDPLPQARPYNSGDVLRIGVFGAMRPQKNLLTAAWAALQIATTLKARCEISINSGRVEGGQSVLKAIRELVNGMHGVSLVEAGWMTWSQFRAFVGHQHLLLSPSYTESFCNVTADGIAEGVPSVVTPAIPWAPKSWQADGDDVNAIAQTGLKLLADKRAATDGQKALAAHNATALRSWQTYLDSSRVAA